MEAANHRTKTQALHFRKAADLLGEAWQEITNATRIDDPSAVVLKGSSVIASSNRLRGEGAMLILDIGEEENRFAALGNLAPGGTHLGFPIRDLTEPWKSLNPPVS